MAEVKPEHLEAAYAVFFDLAKRVMLPAVDINKSAQIIADCVPAPKHQHHVLCSCLDTSPIGSYGCRCRIEYGAAPSKEKQDVCPTCGSGERGKYRAPCGPLPAAGCTLSVHHSWHDVPHPHPGPSCTVCGSTMILRDGKVRCYSCGSTPELTNVPAPAAQEVTCDYDSNPHDRDTHGGYKPACINPKLYVPAPGAAPQIVSYMHATGKGCCYAHGPYDKSVTGFCPKWPACLTDPPKAEFMPVVEFSQATPEVERLRAELDRVMGSLEYVEAYLQEAVQFSEATGLRQSVKPLLEDVQGFLKELRGPDPKPTQGASPRVAEHKLTIPEVQETVRGIYDKYQIGEEDILTLESNLEHLRALGGEQILKPTYAELVVEFAARSDKDQTWEQFLLSKVVG